MDVLDVHFYPQNNIYEAGKPNDPAVMEKTRSGNPRHVGSHMERSFLMGRETNHVIRLLPMLREWIAENNPGMQVALGEYAFGGEKDISGGIAQVELLGIYAREKLDLAFYWFFPTANSPQYFAYKLYRNPDGQHTLFGDRYLPTTCDHADDVSIHAAKDAKTGRPTLMLVNKRSGKDARVKLTFKRGLPPQDFIAYEYGEPDPFCIGQLPAQHAEGQEITIELSAMSVKRFDLVP